MTNILIAPAVESRLFIVQMLSDYDFLESESFLHAVSLMLGSEIGLFLIYIHFEESRANELVKTIRADPNHSDTPIIIIRTIKTEFEEALFLAVEALDRVCNIEDYLELAENPEAPAKLLKEISKHVLLKG